MHLAIQGDDISVYKAYIKDTKSFRYLSESFLFSDANNMDPGTVSKHLSTLTKIEEMIITHIHIHLQVVNNSILD